MAMPKGYAGDNPFGSGYKRTTKEGKYHSWSLKGYTTNATGYSPGHKQGTSGEYKYIRMNNGSYAKVPIGDYEEFLGFNLDDPNKGGRAESLDIESEMGRYVEDAFFSDKKVLGFEAKGGHIKAMQFAPNHQLLMVMFTKNDDVMVFFRVPRELFYEFKFLSEGQTQLGNDKTPRHLLGIRFWDYVRVRGTDHGTRYEGQYLQRGAPTAPMTTEGRVYKNDAGNVTPPTVKKRSREFEIKNAEIDKALAANARNKPVEDAVDVNEAFRAALAARRAGNK